MIFGFYESHFFQFIKHLLWIIGFELCGGGLDISFIIKIFLL